VDGHRWGSGELIVDQLIDVARKGLHARKVDEEDIERYLGIIDGRVKNQLTGAQWQLSSLASMKRRGNNSRSERLDSLVESMVSLQKTGLPGHKWPLATVQPKALNTIHGTRVEHFMSTDLFTVQEDELVDFVAVLMSWRHIRHVLVEDDDHRLVGLVTHRTILKALTELSHSGNDQDISVGEIMVPNPISVSPETATIEAIRLMRENNIGALPVVLNNHLVGILTETDFNLLAARLFENNNESAL